MVSLIDLLPFYVGAACIGVAWAMRLFEGTAWRWPVTIAAGIAGWLVCRLVIEGFGRIHDLRCKKKLRSLSVPELAARIGHYETPEWDFVMLELKARGENLTEYRSRLIDLLGDYSGPFRLFAFKALYAVFPQDIAQMKDYSPYADAEICQEKVLNLKKTIKAQQSGPAYPPQGVGSADP